MDATAEATKIGTLDELQAALSELGYECNRVDMDGDGTPEPLLTAVINVDDKSYSIVISQEEHHFLVDCEFCQLKDLSDDNAEKMTAQLLAVLALNHDIAPFAFAVVDSGLDGIDPTDPIVLVHRLPIGDLSVEEVNQAFASLRQGINAAVVSI
jgi:hypothetical protein